MEVTVCQHPPLSVSGTCIRLVSGGVWGGERLDWAASPQIQNWVLNKKHQLFSDLILMASVVMLYMLVAHVVNTLPKLILNSLHALHFFGQNKEPPFRDTIAGKMQGRTKLAEADKGRW